MRRAVLFVLACTSATVRLLHSHSSLALHVARGMPSEDDTERLLTGLHTTAACTRRGAPDDATARLRTTWPSLVHHGGEEKESERSWRSRKRLGAGIGGRSGQKKELQ